MISNNYTIEHIRSTKMNEERLTEDEMRFNKEELFDIENEQYIETPWNIIE